MPTRIGTRDSLGRRPALVKRSGADNVIGLSDRAETGEVQAGAALSLWWAPLDISAGALRGLSSCLSPDERQRADRFLRPLHRARFLAARGWLRHLLARQLSCAPGEVRIVTGDGGKPMLADAGLCFSAARSAGIALYATSRTIEVGVDVEAIRATADIEGIAARFFSRAEQRALASLPPAQRLAASFQCWTRKEAYVKGIGAGLTVPLRTLDVWAGGRERVTVSGWSVHQVDIAPGFAAAVAGAGTGAWVPKAARKLGADVESVRPRENDRRVPSCHSSSGSTDWRGHENRHGEHGHDGTPAHRPDGRHLAT
jgi:4'-phosphopantetheinyl transferase